jgi:polyisoprenoid-binding protein YceI
MKTKFTLAALALPIAFGGYVVFHPGIAYAEPGYAKPGNERPLPQAGTLTVDPLHTSVGFEIGHLGLSKVQGRFGQTSGTIQADAKNLDASSVSFTIQTESIDTAVAPRNAHLKTADFFDVAKYPEITFKSTKIRKRGKGYVAEGLLTMKAATRPIEIPFKVYGPISDPWGNTRIGVVTDPITLNRQDYGIAYNEKLPDGTPAVANEVTVRISLEATLNKPAPDKAVK